MITKKHERNLPHFSCNFRVSLSFLFCFFFVGEGVELPFNSGIFYPTEFKYFEPHVVSNMRLSSVPSPLICFTGWKQHGSHASKSPYARCRLFANFLPFLAYKSLADLQDFEKHSSFLSLIVSKCNPICFNISRLKKMNLVKVNYITSSKGRSFQLNDLKLCQHHILLFCLFFPI